LLTRSPRLALWLAALVIAVIVAGCGSSSSSSSSSSSTSAGSGGSSAPSVAANPKAAALVPPAIKSKGTVTVAADATYPPDEFIQAGKVVGMDVDLAKALFPLLGLKANVQNATFATIIPGLSSGKFDVGMSSFTDTKAREKALNFVDYFTAGEAFFEGASGGPPVTGLSNLCGLKVAVESGTTEQSDAAAQSKKCTAAGKGAVTVLVFPDQSGATLALNSGRAQVGFVDSPVANYVVKQNSGTFRLVGPTFATAPYGIAVPKTSGRLDQAILEGLKALMANGQYSKILTQWGIQAGGLTSFKINGATS
jgi:polar amino acid transport system substrate-binding protein